MSDNKGFALMREKELLSSMMINIFMKIIFVSFDSRTSKYLHSKTLFNTT